jgi:excisionase family DNA binding protein
MKHIIERLNSPSFKKFVEEVLPKLRAYFLGVNKDANELDFLESLNEIYSVDLSDYVRLTGKDYFDNEVYKSRRIIEYLREKIYQLKDDQKPKLKSKDTDQGSQKIDLNKKVLNLKEAAMLLGFSTSYLYKLMHRRAIEFSKPNGKTIYFDREYLETYMLSGKSMSKDEIEREAMSYCTPTEKKG